MIKIILTSAVLLFVITNSNGQNLINNSSFETFSQCPNGPSQFFIDDWKAVQNTSSSPEQYNSCAGNGTASGVPNNIVGSEIPEEGEGYVGIFVYGDNSVNREYIQTQLQEPLVGGEEYTFSFYVSVADVVEFGINNIGAVFRETPLTGVGQSLILANPQVNSEDVISTKEGWFLISESFVAQGGEEYVSIGNFFSDADTQTLALPPFTDPGRSYIYIDSVSLEMTILNGGDFITADSVLLFPNPVNDFIEISLQNNVLIKQITISDINGREIETKFLNVNNPMISTSSLSKGVYFLKLVDNQNAHVIKRFIKK